MLPLVGVEPGDDGPLDAFHLSPLLSVAAPTSERSRQCTDESARMGVVGCRVVCAHAPIRP